MPETDFKDSFLQLLKQAGGLPYLFVGSGLSRRYLHSENWVDLLKKFARYTDTNYFEYSARIDSEQIDHNESLRLPAIASAIGRDFISKFFRESDFEEARSKYESISGEPDMPLKIAVAEYINKYTLDISNLDETLNQEIELLSQSKIRGIITTNYDTLLETIFAKFSVFSGQNDLITSQLTLVHDIYKIHGSSTDPNSIVLTLNDYRKFLDINKYLVSKILTIFVENPILFIGYSVSDHNIQTIISDIITIAKDRNDIKEKINNKMIIIEWNDEISEPSIERITKTVLDVEVPMTVIKVADYIEVFQVLADLTEIIPQSVLKYVLQNLYSIRDDTDVEQAARPVMLVDKDSYSDDNIDELEIVIGFGVKEKIKVNSRGYEGVSLEDILNDLLDDRLIIDGYKPEKLLLSSFETSFPASFYTFVPLCKYLHLSGRFENTDPFIDIPHVKELYDKVIGIEGYSKYYSSPPSKKRIETLKSYIDFNSYISRANLDNDFVHDLAALIEDRGIDFIDVAKLDNFIKFQAPNLSNLSAGYKSKLICMLDKIKYNPR